MQKQISIWIRENNIVTIRNIRNKRDKFFLKTAAKFPYFQYLENNWIFRIQTRWNQPTGINNSENK